jgi:hypothetical protein
MTEAVPSAASQVDPRAAMMFPLVKVNSCAAAKHFANFTGWIANFAHAKQAK